MDFRQFLLYLESWQVLEYFLPFVLIFVIVFAVLQRVPVLGDKKFNAVVSAVLGFMVVIPHALNPRPDSVVSIINASAPSVVALIVAVTLAIILSSSLTGQKEIPYMGQYGIYLALAIVAYIFASQAWPNTFPFFESVSQATINLIVMLLAFGIVVAYIVGRGNGGGGGQDSGQQQGGDG